MNPENQVSVGLSQFTGGANGLITSANIVGAPATYATTAGVFAPGCTLYQRDSSTGYRTVVWQNTGTAAVPVWTSQAIANIIAGSGATVTLTQAQSGSIILMDRASGIVFTLPTPVIGTTFKFIAKVSVTTNAYKIITSAGTVFIAGTLITTKASDGTVLACFGDATTIIAINMAGTTKGGLIGTTLMLTCVSTTLWVAEGLNSASGSIETPFATS